MAANQNDYFTKSVRKFSTTLGAGGLADATSTSGAFQATTNLSTDTAIYFTVDRVDANGTKTPDKEESCIGIVSGSNLTSLLRGVEGTAQAHSAGAVVECRLLAHQWNRIVDGILVGHNQDGSHKTTLVASIKATAAEVTTGTDDTKVVTPKALKDATQTIVNPVLTTPNTTQGIEAYTPSAADTVTLDLSDNKPVKRITMPAGNITLAISNAVVGRYFIVEIVKDNSTTPRTITWFTTITWVADGGTLPALTTTANGQTTYGFRVTSTGTYDGYLVGSK